MTPTTHLRRPAATPARPRPATGRPPRPGAAAAQPCPRLGGRRAFLLVRRVGAGVAAVVLPGAVAAALVAAPVPPLDMPALDPAGIAIWLAEAGPSRVVFAVGRLVAIGLGAYLSLAAAVGIAARMLAVPRLVRWADAFTLPPVRRLVDAAVGVSLAVGTVVGPVAGPAAAEGAGVSTGSLRWVETPERSTDEERPLPEFDGQGARTEPAPPQPTTTTTSAIQAPQPPVPDGASEPGPPAPVVADVPPAAGDVDGRRSAPSEAPGPLGAPIQSEPANPPSAPGSPTWTVAAGQSFWRIAEDVLAAAWERPATAGEVVDYWRVLIDANRTRLVRPGDPDLIRPGQVLDLPSPPARPP